MRLKHCVQGSARFAVFMLLFGFLMLALVGTVNAAVVVLSWAHPVKKENGTPLALADIEGSVITLKQRNKPDVIKTVDGNSTTLKVSVNGSACVSYLVQTKSNDRLSDPVVISQHRLVKSKLVECK